MKAMDLIKNWIFLVVVAVVLVTIFLLIWLLKGSVIAALAFSNQSGLLQLLLGFSRSPW